MADVWEPPSRGALDDTAWPNRLKGRAIACEVSDDRLFGYAVVSDVARNYAFSDLIYLGLVGELPDATHAHRFAVAMCAAAAISVAEAPVHAAVLARLSGSTFASALATGLVIVADRARQVVADHAALLAWLGSSDPLPVEFGSEADLAWVGNLAAVAGVELPHTTRAAALLVLLHASGLRRAEQFEAAMVAAQVASVSAEALQTGPQHLADYPVKTPEFRYVEGRSPSPDPTGIATVRRK